MSAVNKFLKLIRCSISALLRKGFNTFFIARVSVGNMRPDPSQFFSLSLTNKINSTGYSKPTSRINIRSILLSTKNRIDITFT